MITIEAKIKDRAAQAALQKYAELHNRLLHKLYVDIYVRGKNLAETKSRYLSEEKISGRHFNSIASDLKGKVNAALEREERHRKQVVARILATDKKIKSLEKKFKDLKSTLKGLDTHAAKVATWRANERKGKKPKLAAKLVKTKEILKNLKSELKKLPFVIHQKKRRANGLRHVLAKLEKKEGKPSLCFGSQTLFAKQFHLAKNGYANHGEWLQDWRKARSSQSNWLGSGDESFRNQNLQYNPETHVLKIRLPELLEAEFGENIFIKDVSFPYRGDDLKEVICKQVQKIGKKEKKEKLGYRPVSYRFLERLNKQSDEKELYLQASFKPTVPKPESKIDLGAIGLDLNADHIAVCETDRFGNPIRGYSLAFDFKNKSSEQVKAILGDHCTVLVQHAKQAGKPLICEELDFDKKKQALRETASKYMRSLLSSFAYKKFYELLCGRAGREQVKVISVNPAFTSLIGFVKFAGYESYTTHELAALSIARRGMRLSERLKTKNAPFGPARIQGIDDVLSTYKDAKIGHVWSFYSRAKENFRSQLRSSSRTSRSCSLSGYSPRHPSVVTV